MPSITCVAREHVGARLHQLGDGAAVARAFDDEIGDERDRLRMIELHAALEPAPRHHRRHGDQQLVLLARGQMHGFSSIYGFTSADALEYHSSMWPNSHGLLIQNSDGVSRASRS